MSRSLFSRFRALVPLAVFLAAVLLLTVVPAVLAAPTGQDITTRSCAFGASWMDSIDRLLAGAFIALGLLTAVIVAIFRRAGEGGGMFAGAVVGGIDFGGAVLVVAIVGILAALAVTAAALPACP